MNHTKRKSRRQTHTPTFTTLFNDLMKMGETVSQSTGLSRLAVNVSKADDAYLLEVAVPGIKKEDISLSIENGKLTISTKETPTEGDYRLREFNLADTKRSFTLPKDVDVSGIQASQETGILSITLPIKAEAKAKTINIL